MVDDSPTSSTPRGVTAEGKKLTGTTSEAFSAPITTLVQGTILTVIVFVFVVGVYYCAININGYVGSRNKYGINPCNFDHEGSWSIAFASIKPTTVGPLSFKEIISMSTRESTGPENSTQSIRTHTGGSAFFNPFAMSCAVASKRTPKMGRGSYSFTADPFLFLPPGGHRSLGAAGYIDSGVDVNAPNPIFLFYEMKNLLRLKGELGVSVSYDNGGSFQPLGTALKSSEHLSYPFVIFDQLAGDGMEDGEIVMIPQSSPLVNSLKGYLGTQRVYTTKPSLFPFGWTHVATPLSGGKFADASPVFFKGRWYVWITEIIDGNGKDKKLSYHLDLYNLEGPSLSTSTWTKHPSSPITTDMKYARMGGRPVVHNGVVYRPAQDCSHGYGVGVTYMKVKTLTSSEYVEEPHQSMTPLSFLDPSISEKLKNSYMPHTRLHHIDAQEYHPGHWMAVIDGERFGGLDLTSEADEMEAGEEIEIVDFDDYYIHILCVIIIVGSLIFLWKKFQWQQRLDAATKYFREMSTNTKAAADKWSSQNHQLCSFLAAMGILFLSLGVAFILFDNFHFFQRFALDSFIGSKYNLLPHSQYESENEVPKTLPKNSPYNPGNLHVLTGASSAYFDRIANLVASVQMFEPELQIVVFDFGFSSHQRAQLACMHNVKLSDFDFSKYPPYIENLGNFAFKMVAMNEYMDTFDNSSNLSILWLDSGLEALAPFVFDIKSHLSETGQISGSQAVLLDSLLPQVEKLMGPEEAASMKGKHMCAGGFQGYVRNSEAHVLVLRESLKCALDKACIENIPSQDQGVFTALLRKNGFVCLRKDIYLQNRFEKLLPDRSQPSNHYFFAARRMRLPLAFKSRIKWNEDCTTVTMDAKPLLHEVERPVNRGGLTPMQNFKYYSQYSYAGYVASITCNVGFIGATIALCIVFESILRVRENFSSTSSDANGADADKVLRVRLQRNRRRYLHWIILFLLSVVTFLYLQVHYSLFM